MHMVTGKKGGIENRWMRKVSGCTEEKYMKIGDKGGVIEKKGK